MLRPSGGTPQSVQDRAPEMSVRGNRFAALAGAETDAMPDMNDAVATQPAQVPLPTWIDEESQGEYPRQRRRLQLISQSTRVLGADAAIHAHVAEEELRVVADDRHPGVSSGEVQANDDDSCIRFQVPVFGGS